MKYSIIRRLISSVLLLIVPLLLLQGYLFVWSRRIVADEITGTARGNLQYLQEYLEQKTQDLYDASNILLTAETVGQFHARLAHGTFESESEYYTSILDIRSLLRIQKYSNELVSEIQLVFPEFNLVIAHDTLRKVDQQKLLGIYSASEKQTHYLLENEGDLYSIYLWNKSGTFLDRVSIMSLVKLNPGALSNVLSSYSEPGTKSSYLLNMQTMQLLSSERAFDVPAELLAPLVENLQGDTFAHRTLQVNGVSYEAFGCYSEILKYAVIQLVPSALFNQIPSSIGALILVLCIATLAVLIKLLSVLRKTVGRPVDGLQQAFEEAGKGNFGVRLPRQEAQEFDRLAVGFNAMAGHIDNLIDSNYRQTIRLQTAELKRLQAQINPHFLYNSFYFLRHLISAEETETAEEFCRYLGRYFRYITRSDQNTLSMREEYGHAVNYLRIQLMRFGDTVEAEIQPMPEELGDLCVPRLIVEPVVENCFKHGMNTTEKTGWIRMALVDEGETVYVEIENNGDDLTDEALAALRTALDLPAAEASFTGLVNTHHRLRLFFGRQGGVEVARGSRGGLLVRLRITRHPVGSLEDKEAARHDFSGSYRR